MSETSDDETEKKAPVDQGTSVLEWIAAACGAMIFLAMIGYMAIIGFTEVEGAPAIELASAEPVRQGAAFHVGFTATNTGAATATGLVVRATLSDGDKEIESQEATIDYLPRQSSRRGGFFFAHDPAQYQLNIAAISYLDP